MKPYLLLMATLCCQWCIATCMLSKIPIDSRTSFSNTIIDGQVTDQRSYWNADKSLIYTVSTVQVNNRLKGASQPTIEIITPGGELDGKLLVVEPNAELQIGSKGIFFLKNNTIALNYTSTLKQYEIYSLAQGFIEEDQLTGKYRDPFDEYANRTVVYSQIGKTTGMNYRMVNNNAASNVNAGSITSFSPSSITAGTQSVLTIYGTGFGTKTGQATVQFRDANSTNANACVSVPDSNYILSWTNTKIEVMVPGASAFRQGGSGTGLVNVIDANGVIIPSATALNVTFNQFEYKRRRVALIGQNGQGGYTFTLNSSFSANTAAKATFTRALAQWTCTTGVNAIVGSTTTSSACNNQLDNMNIVSFADASCPLPAGALGTTYSSYSLCSNSPVLPDGMDMIFSPDANFYMGTANPASNQYDFESVVLHELGHAFGEGHSSNGNEVMYPTIGNGFVKRTLNPVTDIANVRDVILRSNTVTSICGYLKHTPTTPTCATTPSIAASFTADKATGCAPLTVSFTDKTTGSPTAWKWDVDNNGSTDYTTQNPSHTFTKAGMYSIRLVVSNAGGTDSVVKLSQILVREPVKVSVEASQSISCFGATNGSVKAVATGGDENYTYSWNNSLTSQTITNLPAGKYTVVVKDGNNCTATSNNNLTQPQPIELSVDAQSNGTATLNITGGTTPYSYALNNSAVNRIDANMQTLTNLAEGNYTISIKDKNNCSTTSSFVIAAPTPVGENANKISSLEVFPNPATTNVNYNLSMDEEKDVTIELIDLTGRTVFQEQYSNIKEKQASVDVSMLPNGTYMLRFGTPEGSTIKKIIVSR